MERMKQFFKDKKNVALVILSLILVSFVVASPTSTYTEEINKLKEEIKTQQEQIKQLENDKKKLESELNVSNSQNTFNTNYSKSTTDNSTTKQETVWITNNGNKYHSSNCRALTDNRQEITLEQAQNNGYEPCGICIK